MLEIPKQFNYAKLKKKEKLQKHDVYTRITRDGQKSAFSSVLKLNLWYKLSFTNGKILILDGIDGLRKL